ncbi:hypothetical protein FRC17_009781 [Serendipita sp. 399]|nr:hypothetical protein FRC17_009781 [Serendipita sp. 399]
MSFRSSGKPYARTSSGGGIPDGQWLHDRAPGAEKTRTPRVTESHNVSGQNAKLLIDNLHYEVSEKDLVSLFGKYGPFARGPRIRTTPIYTRHAIVFMVVIFSAASLDNIVYEISILFARARPSIRRSPLQFDRSGRSLGTAVVIFENAEDAKAAQRALNKQLAKGQELVVRFDDTPSGTGRGAASLLSRMDKGSSGSLASRLGDAPKSGENGNQSHHGGVGPHRTRGGRGGGRGGHGRDRPPPKKPLTAEQLDKDLESYGGRSEESPAVQAGPAESGPASSSKPADEDVEMS